MQFKLLNSWSDLKIYIYIDFLSGTILKVMMYIIGVREIASETPALR